MRRISVIIPTYNSKSDKKNSIEIVLRSLLCQTLTDFDVIIVDNGTDDTTLADLASLFSVFSQRGISVSVVPCRRRGNKCLARNMGAEAAMSDILVFLDDDSLLITDSALEHILRNLQPRHFACGAKRYWTILFWDGEKAVEQARKNQFDYLRSVALLPRGIKRGSGMRDLSEFTWIACFGAVWKEDFDGIGGFDVNYGGWGRHDMDLMLRLLVNGFAFLNLFEDISVIHLNHRVIAEDLKKKHENISYYLEKEKGLGIIFKPNHLFGVYEGDGSDILVSRPEQ